MTDPDVADKTYIEPICLEVLEKILKKEKPDAILPTMGGQTALNLAMEAEKKGILKKYKIEHGQPWPAWASLGWPWPSLALVGHGQPWMATTSLALVGRGIIMDGHGWFWPALASHGQPEPPIPSLGRP